MPERPGGALPEHMLYEETSEGFKDPEGNNWKFEEGESLAHLQQDEGGRATYVKQLNGTLVPVEVWKQGKA